MSYLKKHLPGGAKEKTSTPVAAPTGQSAVSAVQKPYMQTNPHTGREVYVGPDLATQTKFAAAGSKTENPDGTFRKRTREVRNNAGGVVHEISLLDHVKRLLICGLGQGGSFYQSEEELVQGGMKTFAEILSPEIEDETERDGLLAILEEFARKRKCPKMDPLIFAIAFSVCKAPNEAFKAKAYALVPIACGIPTHLFMFLAFCKALGRGWGRKQRDAVAGWYNGKGAVNLAVGVTKYQNREGYTHTDALRLSHAQPCDLAHQLLFAYAVGGWDAMRKKMPKDWDAEGEGFELVPSGDGKPAAEYGKKRKRVYPELSARDLTPEQRKELAAMLDYLSRVERVKKAENPEDAIALMHSTVEGSPDLVREHLPTTLLSEKRIWEHLLPHMPPQALLRNVNKMTAVGIPESDIAAAIETRGHKDHPLRILNTSMTYANGKGNKGSLTWSPYGAVISALTDAFKKSFGEQEPIGLPVLYGCDVSPSMNTKIAGMNVTAMQASTALVMLAAVTEREEDFHNFFFSSGDPFVPRGNASYGSVTGLHKVERSFYSGNFEQIMKRLNGMWKGGSTDCSLPMVYALENELDVAAFVVFTDNETYAGKVKPVDALRAYRKSVSPTGFDRSRAKLIVVGMTQTKFTIADPDDPYMLDIAGFDTSMPELIREFVRL